MTIKRFEDFLIWQKAEELVLEIYRVFLSCKDYSFKDQIFRAAVSIMNNIAEGYERGTNKEFRNFLYISKGSCGETRSMLHLAQKLGYISQEVFNHLYQEALDIAKMTSGLIKKL